MTRGCVFLSVLLFSTPLFAQPPRIDAGPVGPNGGVKVECIFGCGPGSGGVVDQGVGGVSPWKVNFDVPQHVIIDSMPAGGSGLTDTELRATPVPVSGTFWQATQPVSGTFWQATQPISGTVAVSNFPATQAVTGTFFQATQPVSLATAPTTPVTGTFWQATQPVSGTFWQATQPVSGTFFQATQPVSNTSGVLVAGTLAATTTAAALAGSTAIVEVVIQSDPDNTVDVLCGSAAAQPVQLKPGDGLKLNVTNLNIPFCKTVSGTATVAYIGR